jgi:hypothetical protein
MNKMTGQPCKRQVVYVSQKSDGFNSAELAAMLRKAWENNEKYGITGLLLQNRGQFMQLIEGPEPSVEALLQNLKADSRHEHMSVLLDRKIPEIEFVCWLMGYDAKGTYASTTEAAALQEFMIDSRFLSDIQTSSPAVRLLRSFAEL